MITNLKSREIYCNYLNISSFDLLWIEENHETK
jgi:hypothetical protein